MPVSSIGNLTFINQNTALPATQMSNEMAKESFAAIANLNEFAQKEKTIDKLGQVTKTHEIDEEIKEKAEEEKKRKGKENSQENSNENTSNSEENSEEILEENSDEANFKNAHNIHRLDISI